MARKSPSKVRSKPPRLASTSPIQGQPNTEKMTASIPSSEDPQGKDSQLAALLKEAEEMQPNGPAAAPVPQPAAEQPVPEVYRRVVYPLALGFSAAADWSCRRFINCGFSMITKEEAAMFEEDAAFCLKEAIDQWLPLWAKEHPRMTALLVTVGTVCASKIHKLPIKEPVGSTGGGSSPARPPVTGSPTETPKAPVPEVHEVAIDTGAVSVHPGGAA